MTKRFLRSGWFWALLLVLLFILALKELVSNADLFQALRERKQTIEQMQ